MQNKKTKFKSYLTGLIFLAIIFCGFFGLAKSSQAANVWAEDYENFDLGRYYNVSNQNYFRISTAYAHGGTYSLEVDPPNSVYLMDTFTAQPSSEWMWMTFWIYVPSGWTVGGDGFMHFASLQYSSQYVQADFRGGGLTEIYWNDINAQNVGGLIATPEAYFQGKWSKVQVGVQYSTKSTQLWVDDVQKYGCTNCGDFSTNHQVEEINVRIEVPNGGNSGHLYYDDVSVDAGIRPTSESDTTPPAAPSGLSVL
jgi:hypothetical protein